MEIHRMKHSLLSSLLAPLLLALPVLAPSSLSAQTREGGRIVFVNLDKVFNEYYKTKLADEQLKSQADEFNVERKEMIDSYEAMQKEFSDLREESGNPALNEEARNKLRNQAEEKLLEIREQEQKIRNFDNSRRKQLEEQGRRMRKRIVDEIREKIQVYARNKDYTAVIDTSGQSLNGVELILFTDQRADVTASVIQMLNSEDK